MMEDNTTLTKSKEETINKCEIFGPKCFTVAIDIFNLPYEAIIWICYLSPNVLSRKKIQ